jgi:hypothetical protein
MDAQLLATLLGMITHRLGVMLGATVTAILALVGTEENMVSIEGHDKTCGMLIAGTVIIT